MQANSPAASQDALRTMMHLSQAQECLTEATAELKNIKQRADKVNKEALELEDGCHIGNKVICILRSTWLCSLLSSYVLRNA